MEEMRVRIVGVSPLLMHNGHLANPMNEHARSISELVKTAKKSKTDVAWNACYKAEFMGGLYLDDNLEPCLPGELIEAVITEGAKKSKQGREVKAGLIVDGNAPLEYKGPRNAEGLWKAQCYKQASAKVGQNRIIRTRPMFASWAAELVLQFNPALINRKDVFKFLEKAGAEVGCGDWRPKYGRFTVEASA